jgi:predicted fused transcriptional regulator/phosphomethylpyrimidine kinase/predicted transcriptional regulator
MVKKFLPAIRGLVAHKLKELGLEQEKIAKMVGVTQASVSHYLSVNPDHFIAKLEQFGTTVDQVQSMVDDLSAAVQKGDSAANDLLYNYWRLLASSGSACSAHRTLSGGLVDCDLCVRVMVKQGISKTKYNVLAAIREACSLIEASPTFGYLIPEVYSNLVYALADATKERDVAAIPGRIIRVKGKAKVLMEPEFGSSKHMANVILSLKKLNPWVRAALNTSFDKDYLKSIEQITGNKSVYLKAYSLSKEFFDQLRKTRVSRPISAVVDPGANGYEPNIYLVGGDPVTVTNVAISASTLWYHSVRQSGSRNLQKMGLASLS